MTEEHESSEHNDNSQFAVKQRVGKLQEFHEISSDDRSCFLNWGRIKSRYSQAVSKSQVWKFTHLSPTAREALMWLSVIFLPSLLWVFLFRATNLEYCWQKLWGNVVPKLQALVCIENG